MKRTAEKALSIISAVFTVISIIFGFISLSFVKMMNADQAFRLEMETELLSTPDLSAEEAQLILSFIDLFEGFIWIILVMLIISLIATIIGIIFIWNNKNPKLAGVMFIIAGLLVFLFSPTSIMLYIAAILCFTKKPPYTPEQLETPFYGNAPDDSMRPL